TRAFAVSEYRISALPQRGHLFSPSSRPELVSMMRFAERRRAVSCPSSGRCGGCCWGGCCPPGAGGTGPPGREGPAGWSGRACSGPCGGTLITLLGARSQPERGLLRRLVVRFGDQALVEHLLVLGDLRDRIGRRGLGGPLLLRGLLAGRGPGLGLADHAAGGSHARPEHRQSRAAAVLAGGLHTARGGLVHEGLRAGAGERVGLLHVLEQLAGVLVVLDRDDRGLHDREPAIAGPAVVLLHRGRERLGEAHRVALDAGDAIAL